MKAVSDFDYYDWISYELSKRDSTLSRLALLPGKRSNSLRSLSGIALTKGKHLRVPTVP